MVVEKRKTINSFVGLRFLFALAVFLHHLDFLSTRPILGFGEIYKFLFEGFIGVNFFFILSGFVITYGYERKLKEGSVTDAKFIFCRFARLWPLHIVTLIMASYVYGAFAGWFTKSFWTNVFMLQSFVPTLNETFGFNGLSWCISTELFFYVAFCGLVYLSRKKKMILLAFLMLASAVSIQYSDQFNNIAWLIYVNPLFRLMDFVAGMVLCDIFIHTKIVISKIFATVLEAGSIIGLGLLAYYAVRSNMDLLWRYDLFYIIPISLLVFVFAFDRGYIADFFSMKVFQFLGKISFEIYLVHQIVLIGLDKHLSNYLASLSAVGVFAIVGLIVSIIAAAILHYFIGEPAYKKLCNLWNYFSTKGKGTYTNIAN